MKKCVGFIGLAMVTVTVSVCSNETLKAQTVSTRTNSTEKASGADLSQKERVAIVEEAGRAVQRYFRTDPKERKGDEIPKEFWGEAITKLKPVRVMHDRVNVAITLQDSDKIEQGLYVSLAISSYSPNHDKRFTTFEKLSQPEDKSFNTLYRYSIKKTNTEANKKSKEPKP
jgi:hypothetical protein